MGVLQVGKQRCVVPPLVKSLWGVVHGGLPLVDLLVSSCRTSCQLYTFDALSTPRPLTHVRNCRRVWWWRAGS